MKILKVLLLGASMMLVIVGQSFAQENSLIISSPSQSDKSYVFSTGSQIVYFLKHSNKPQIGTILSIEQEGMRVKPFFKPEVSVEFSNLARLGKHNWFHTGAQVLGGAFIGVGVYIHGLLLARGVVNPKSLFTHLYAVPIATAVMTVGLVPYFVQRKTIEFCDCSFEVVPLAP